MHDDDKRIAALAAVAEVRDGMLVGLGTGSTATHAIAAIGALVAQGLTIRAVATSDASAAQARSLGIPLLDMADVATIDLTIDGADEIDPRLLAIKGAGGAMTREKIVAAASSRMVVVADGSKRVERLGAAPVPIEMLPFACSFVERRVCEAGGTGEWRRAGSHEPYTTDGGNPVFDARFAELADPVALAGTLDAIPGIVGHGLFVTQVAAAYIAEGGIVTKLERSAERG